MPDPLISVSQAESAGGPLVVAVSQLGAHARSTAAHSHARGQLLGALRGLLTVGTRDSQWVVPAIHSVWIPPHHVHSLRSHGVFSGWSVYVAPAACAALPDAPCTMRTSGLLREAVMRAATWPGAEHDDTHDDAQTRIAGVILDEIRTLPREPLGLPLPRDPRLVRIAQALADDLANHRRLDEWADWAGVPVRTLTRRFVAETGFSFTEWRQRARLLRALEMLAADTPVTNVALDLGYDSISAFIAMFRRTFGVTPTQYFPSPKH